MATVTGYVLMFHMLGSVAAPLWRPADDPIHVYASATECNNRATFFTHYVPGAAFSCPMAIVEVPK